MAELKTQQNDASVETFLDGIEHKKRQADTRAVCTLMARTTGWQAKMWGKSIIGFGAYDYKYESGRGGRWMIVGLSPRKTSLTVYIMPGFAGFPELMSKIGKYKIGKSCLYINKLEDVDLSILEQLIAQSVEVMKDRYSWAAE